MRQKVIVGNWKLNLSKREATTCIQALKTALNQTPLSPTIEVGICPPFVHIPLVQTLLINSSLYWGAQNCYSQPSGAYTGEVSAPMLSDYQCRYVIVGHSERRQLFNESNHDIQRKVQHVLEHDLIPILCIGETHEDRQNGKEYAVIQTQLAECLAGIPKKTVQNSRCIIAYEPIWAIGTGQVATAKQAQNMHHFIRTQLSSIWDVNVAQQIQIQYGGSVKPDNIVELITQPDIDGALVGGASLNPDTFSQIILQCNKLEKALS